MGHSELRCAIPWEIAWHCHAEVLLRRVLRCWGRRELRVVGACVEDVAEFIGWGGAGTILGTQQQRDHNRNLRGALYAVLPVCVLF